MAEFREEFGSAVRQAMDRPGREMSTREISKRSRGRISPTTVLSMRDGKVVGVELIVEFAKATGADPNDLLDQAGYEYLRYHADRDANHRVRRPLSVGLKLATA